MTKKTVSVQTLFKIGLERTILLMKTILVAGYFEDFESKDHTKFRSGMYREKSMLKHYV